MGQFYPLTDEQLGKIKNKYLDMKYGTDSDLQLLDLYLPDDKNWPYPLIIHTHGGAFANGNQRENQTEPMLRGLERGYAVASIQYRRSREALFPAQIYDVKLAIRFLRANANKYHLDERKFAIWGASSGGWLASIVAVTEGNPAFEDLSMGYSEYDSKVQAVIDWCGPCGDFNTMDDAFIKSHKGIPNHGESDSPESRFMGRCIKDIPELTRLASPMTYVNKDMPPFLIIHGSDDEVVPVKQSIDFARSISRTAGSDRVRLHVVEGKKHHGDPWYFQDWVSDECLNFLDENFKY